MKTIKVAISAPFDKNFYSLLVAQICLDEPGIELVGVCCLKVWSYKRVLFEIKRLGPALIKKIWDKYFTPSIEEDKRGENENLRLKYNLLENSLSDLCMKANIDYKKFSDPNHASCISFLSLNEPDLIVSIGSVILREEFISIPKIGVLNIHKGILPEYRGMGVTEWPLLLKEDSEREKLGVTAHLIEAGVDTGPILLKKYLPLDQISRIEDLEQKYLEITIEAMHKSLKLTQEGLNNLIQQDRGHGKQYFELHHRLKEKVNKKLEKYFDDK